MPDVHAQLVVLDIDGTLLDAANPLSDATTGALRGLQQRGVQIAFASSRPLESVELLARTVGVTAHLIACNGAVAVCASGRELMAQSFVMDMQLIAALRRFSAAGGLVNVYRRSHWLAVGPAASIRHEEAATGLTADVRPSVDALVDIAGTPVLKVMCRGSRSACAQLLDEVRGFAGLAGVVSGSDCCDIQADGVDKARAVNRLRGDLGIAPSGVVAFGDSDSDALMLGSAGYGVAVGAASASARNAAREHIDGPGTDAIAEWLDRVTLTPN